MPKKEPHYENLTGQKYGLLTVISEAKPHYTKSGILLRRWKCICDCGNYVTTYANSLRAEMCSSCGCLESYGEKVISEYLREKEIQFLQQHSFFNCKFKRNLLFDFYLPNNNILIEYNGIQHYKPVDKFSGEKSFLLNKKRYELKKEYAKNNNIKLIEIPYFINTKETIINMLEGELLNE